MKLPKHLVSNKLSSQQGEECEVVPNITRLHHVFDYTSLYWCKTFDVKKKSWDITLAEIRPNGHLL